MSNQNNHFIEEIENNIERLKAELNFSESTKKKAIDIIRKAEEKDLVLDRNFACLAGAAVYIAGILEGERRSQKQIAKTMSVSENAISKRYVELVRELEIKKKK